MPKSEPDSGSRPGKTCTAAGEPPPARPIRGLLLWADETAATAWNEVLRNAGYTVEMLPREGATSDRVANERPDFVALDASPPSNAALIRCRRLRADPRLTLTPLVLLTTDPRAMRLAVAIAAGADDVIVTSPDGLSQLAARIQTVLRRRGVLPARDDIVVGALRISPSRFRVYVNGRPIPDLTPSEFRTLLTLAEEPGIIFSRDRILNARPDAGERAPASKRTVDVQIVGLRRKLGPWGVMIECVHGEGYRLNPHPDVRV